MLSSSDDDNLTSATDQESKTAPLQDYYGHGKNLTTSEGVKRLRDRHMDDGLIDDREMDVLASSQSNHRHQSSRDDRSLESQARHELQVFRRVHLQSTEDFLKSYVGNDKSYFESFDIAHVNEKFPEAEPWLRRRLARSITKRRRILAGLVEAELARVRLDIGRLAYDLHGHDQGQQFEAPKPPYENDKTSDEQAEVGSVRLSQMNGDARTMYSQLPPPHVPRGVPSGETTTCNACSICFRKQQHLSGTSAWVYAINSVIFHPNLTILGNTCGKTFDPTSACQVLVTKKFTSFQPITHGQNTLPEGITGWHSIAQQQRRVYYARRR